MRRDHLPHRTVRDYRGLPFLLATAEEILPRVRTTHPQVGLRAHSREDAAVLDAAVARHWNDQPAALAEYAEERLPNVNALAD